MLKRFNRIIGGCAPAIALALMLGVGAQSQSIFVPAQLPSQGGASGTVLIGNGLGAATTFSATPTVTTLTANQTGLGTTSTDGITNSNTSAATAGTTVQISPRDKWCGTAWNSVGVASETDCFVAEVLPATAAGTTTAQWQLGVSIAGGAVAYPFIVNKTAGGWTFTFGVAGAGMVLTNNNLNLASGGTMAAAAYNTLTSSGAYNFLNRSLITSPADGQLNITNSAVSAGIGFDVTTDGVLKARTRAQTADATIGAGVYWVSGGSVMTQQATFLSNGGGMTVANVGANSCGTTTATIAGGPNANVTTVGATSGTQCRLKFPFAASTEWDCSANDDTTTVAVRTTPVDSTHTDLIGAFTAGDKVTAICFPR